MIGLAEFIKNKCRKKIASTNNLNLLKGTESTTPRPGSRISTRACADNFIGRMLEK
jgi:hypothetical protein